MKCQNALYRSEMSKFCDAIIGHELSIIVDRIGVPLSIIIVMLKKRQNLALRKIIIVRSIVLRATMQICPITADRLTLKTNAV